MKPILKSILFFLPIFLSVIFLASFALAAKSISLKVEPSTAKPSDKVNLKVTLDEPLKTGSGSKGQHVSFLYKEGNSSPTEDVFCQEIKTRDNPNGTIISIPGFTYLTFSGREFSKEWLLPSDLQGNFVVIAALMNWAADSSHGCQKTEIGALSNVPLIVKVDDGSTPDDGTGGGGGDDNDGTGNGGVSVIDALPFPFSVRDNPANFDSLPEFFNTIANILVLLSGVILLFVLILGGYQYIASAGNPEMEEKAKHTLTWAILGIIIVAISFAVAFFLYQVLIGTRTP